MPVWILPATLALSVVATLASLAWLIASLRRIPARFATAFDRIPERPRPIPLPRGIGKAAGALAAAMIANCALTVAMAT